MASTVDSTSDDEEDVEPITVDNADEDDATHDDEEEIDNTDESITVESPDDDASSGEESGEEGVENSDDNNDDDDDNDVANYDEYNYDDDGDDDNDNDDVDETPTAEEETENTDQNDDTESKTSPVAVVPLPEAELVNIRKRFDAQVDTNDDHIVMKPTTKRRQMKIRNRSYCFQHVYEILQRRELFSLPNCMRWATCCDVPRCISHSVERIDGAYYVEDFNHGTCMLAWHALITNSRTATEEEMKINIAVYATPCRIWTGPIAHGRGRINFNSRERSAPAFSWSVANAETIQSPYVARHLCKNVLCIEHIERGTVKENVADRERDGTQLHGSKHSMATISEATAVAIAASHGTGKTQAERAKKFHTTVNVVSDIDRGKSWTHVIHTPLPKIRSPSKMLTAEQVRGIRKSVAGGKTCSEAGKIAGVSYSVARNIITRRSYSSVPDDAKLDSDAAQEKEFKYVEKAKKRLLDGSEPDENGCRIWKRATTNEGAHGLAYFHGNNYGAHILSWILFCNRGVDAGRDSLHVRHLCGVSQCVNHAHLSLGTAAENAQDRHIHGTMRVGSDVVGAVINEEIALEIKRSQVRNEPISSVADRLKISYGIVSNIYTGKNWRHVLLTDDDDLLNMPVVPATTLPKASVESKVEAVRPVDDPCSATTTKTTFTSKRKRMSITTPKRRVMTVAEHALKQVPLPDERA